MSARNVNTGIDLALVALWILFALAPLGIWSQATPDKKSNTVLVPGGTQIHLVLMDDLQGKRLHVKQTVHFKVREDLVLDSELIVKTGAEAVGHIESVSKSGMFGKSGKLVLQFDYVESVAGTRIPLRGGAGVSGGRAVRSRGNRPCGTARMQTYRSER